MEALAMAKGRSKMFQAREEVLTRREDLEDTRVAEQRLADIRAGRVHAIPLEEVLKDHGLAD